MRASGYLLLTALIGVAGCRPRDGATTRSAVEERPEPAEAFRPERMRTAVEGKALPAVRTTLAGRWKFRVTVVGSVEELSVGYFADRDDPSSVNRTGVIAVRLPADSAPGQTWEVEAEFDFDLPILHEKGLLVWRFAKPTSVVRMG